MKFSALLLSAALAALAQSASAGVIARFNTADIGYGPNNGYYIEEPEVWAHDPTVSVTKLVRHGSVTGGDSQAMAYTGWPTALSANDYLSFTVTPNLGETMTLTSLEFSYNRNQHPAAVAYNWAYRLNEGAGFGPWVYAGTIDGAFSAKTWTFPTPITTTGTIEFAFFAAAPDAGTSVYLTNPKLNGTAGDTSPDPSLVGIIQNYTRVTTYPGDLPKEASTLAYSWDTDSLYVVDDEGREIMEVNKQGKRLSQMRMNQLNFPPPGYKGDPEALAYFGRGGDGLGMFMIGAERQNYGIMLKYRPNGDDTPDWMRSTPSVIWGHTNGNVGLEGLSYDNTDGSVWGIKERQPLSVMRATNLGAGTQPPAAMNMNDVNWRLGLTSLSDIYVLANSAAYADSDHILLLARGENKIVEITKTGKVVSTLNIANIGRATMEGITMDDDGVLYLCSEGASTVDYSKFPGALHVLTMPKNIVPATGGRQAIVGTAGDDEIQGNPAADLVTGGAGADTFVFTSLRDGVDTITDFTPGVDLIDVSALLRSINYLGTNYRYNPLLDTTLRIVDSPAGATVQIKVSGSYRTLIVLQGLTAAQVNSEDHFRFITSKLSN